MHAPPDVQERLRVVPEKSSKGERRDMKLPCLPYKMPPHEATHSTRTDRRANLGAPVADPGVKWTDMIPALYCDTTGTGEPTLHLTMWDPEPMGQYVSAHHISRKPVLMQARIGYRPKVSVGVRAVVACRQRRWGSSHHCVNGQSWVGSQGDMLNRMLIPDEDMWKPGVMVCDSCATMMSLAGRANLKEWKDAQHIVFDFDLS